MKRGLIALGCGVLLACESGTEPPTLENEGWRLAAPALTAVYESQGITVGGRLYVFGGFDTPTRATAAVQIFAPSEGGWRAGAPLPELLTHAATATDGRYVYLAGGFIGNHPGPTTAHVWRYDTVNDQWLALVDLPANRGSGAAAVVGRRLHVFGGSRRDNGVWLADHGDHWSLSLDSLAAWRPASPMPEPRNHLAAVVLGGRIYALGGQLLGDEVSGNRATVNVYDPATDQWTDDTPLPSPRGHIGTSTYVRDGRIIVVGGLAQGMRPLAEVLEFDPATARWVVRTPLPEGRQSPVAGVVGDDEYAATGGKDGPRPTTWRRAR